MKILDLYAGAGGWDVAAQQLGHDVAGVEKWRPALETRIANGLPTLFDDVWEPFELNEEHPWRKDPGYAARKRLFDFWPTSTRGMLIASPSCKPFSVAGNGAGRKALADLRAAVAHYATAWRQLGQDPEQTLTSAILEAAEELRRYTAGCGMDPDVANVLVPLLYIDWLFPEYVLLEQVPSVLPVWEEYAEQLTERGYNVWTGIVEADQYGVPQSRRRAVLMARRDQRPVGGLMPTERQGIADVLPGREGWTLRSNYGTSGNKTNRGMRLHHQPAFTVTSKVNRNKWVLDGIMENVSPEEAAVLQTFPTTFDFTGTVNEQCEQIGNAVPPLLAKTLIQAVTS